MLTSIENYRDTQKIPPPMIPLDQTPGLELWQQLSHRSPLSSPAIQVEEKTPEKPKPSGRILEDDLVEIYHLQRDFNLAVGRDANYIPPVLPNWYPPQERWNALRKENNLTEQSRALTRESLRKNIVTSIEERIGRSQITIGYEIINGRIVPKKSPNQEPFGETLIRGKHYRQENGSKDLEREDAEVIAWHEIIEPTLTNPDTPIGTVVISLSPPSEIDNSPYQANYIDLFKSVLNAKGELEIECTRNSTDFSKRDFENLARELSPNFFDQLSGQFDVWCLFHPIISSDISPVIETVGLAPGFCEKVIEDNNQLIEYLLDALTAQDDPATRFSNWLDIAKRHNTLLKMVDKVKDQLLANPESGQLTKNILTSLSPKQQVAILGGTAPEAKAGPCGPSLGINVENPLTKAARKAREGENSVSQFDKENDEGPNYEIGDCSTPKRDESGKELCGKTNVEVGKCTHLCKDCERKFHPTIFA